MTRSDNDAQTQRDEDMEAMIGDEVDEVDEDATIEDILASMILAEWDNWCRPGDEIVTHPDGSPWESAGEGLQVFLTLSGQMVIVRIEVVYAPGLLPGKDDE